ncbi:sulfotransferase 6B1-like [Denticeps clupeoides]|uniref:sulfotransferase 6B1-like n=1 Tax=Denticeps clupeoides TaxID=299321 RepID=UPI0010A33956|nr:sulfotransferase 6B1-like [Denticeps clupeoides]
MDMEKKTEEWRQTVLERTKNMTDEDKVYRYRGLLYSTIMSPVENLEALRTMEARPEDLLLVAYPKCGFNWMIGVVRQMIKAVSGKEFTGLPPHIEFLSPDRQKELAQEPSPRFMGTHLLPENMPASFREKKSKMLVVFRNPKDTAVSFYHFMNSNPVLPKTSWDKFLSEFMTGEVLYGSYFDYALACEKLLDEPNVKMITYEDLKEDLAEGIRQVSQFFGLPLMEEQIRAIAAEGTFSAMSRHAHKTHGDFGKVIFRKGEVGDWKNHFTEAQSRQMDEEFTRRLAGTRLGAKLKYDVYCRHGDEQKPSLR